jgi:hypothetical protein
LEKKYNFNIILFLIFKTIIHILGEWIVEQAILDEIEIDEKNQIKWFSSKTKRVEDSGKMLIDSMISKLNLADDDTFEKPDALSVDADLIFKFWNVDKEYLQAVSDLRTSQQWKDYANENRNDLFPLIEKIIGQNNLLPEEKLNITTCKYMSNDYV